MPAKMREMMSLLRRLVFQSTAVVVAALSQVAVALAQGSTLTISLVDQSGAPFVVSGSALEFYCEELGDFRNNHTVSISSGDSSLTFPVPGSTEYRCSSISARRDGFTFGWESPTTSVPATGNGAAAFTVYRHSATLSVAFQESTETPVSLPSAGPGTISCWNAGTRLFEVEYPLQAGVTSQQLSLPGGYPIRCQIRSVAGFAVPEELAANTPATGEVSRVVTLYRRDAPLTLNFKTPSGETLTIPSGSNAQIDCYNQTDHGLTITEDASPATSSKVMNLVPGRYRCEFRNLLGYLVRSTGVLNVTTAGTTATLEARPIVKDSSIRFNLLKPDGSPLTTSNDSASLSCRSMIGGFFSYDWADLPSAVSSYTLALIGGGDYSCRISGVSGYSGPEQIISVPSGAAVTKDVVFAAIDASIAVSLVNADGSPRMVLAGESVSVACTGEDFGNDATIPVGQSTATVPLVAGRYLCTAYTPSFARTNAFAEVSAGQSGAVQLRVHEASVTATIRTVNPSGQLVDLTADSVEASTLGEGHGHSVENTFMNGQGTLRLAPGIAYQVYLLTSLDLKVAGVVRDQNQKPYAFLNPVSEVMPSQDLTINLTVVPLDATVRLTGSDSSGKPLAGYVVASDGAGLSLGVHLDSNGVASMPVPSGRPLLFTLYQSLHGASLNPPLKTINVEAGSVTSLSLSAPQSNFTLAVNPTFEGATRGDYYCTAFSKSGLSSVTGSAEFGTTPMGQPALLPVTSPDTWYVSCTGFGDTLGGQKLFASPIYTYVTGAPAGDAVPQDASAFSGTPSGTLSFSVASLGPVVSESRRNIDPWLTDTVIPFSNGKVTIPPSAFSSDFTASVSSSLEVIPSTGSFQIVPGTAIKVSARDDAGATLSSGRALSIELSLPKASNPGGAQIVAVQFNPQSRNIVSLATTVSTGASILSALAADPDSKTYSFSASNVGIYALAFRSTDGSSVPANPVPMPPPPTTPTPTPTAAPPTDAGPPALGAVTNLKVSRVGAKGRTSPSSFVAVWRGVDGATSYRVTLTSSTGQLSLDRSVKHGKNLRTTFRAPRKKGRYTLAVSATAPDQTAGAAATAVVRVN